MIHCPRCSRPMSIEPPVSDGGSVVQRALCVNGHSVWRDITPTAPRSPRPYEHMARSPSDSRPCKECGDLVEPGRGRMPEYCLPCAKKRARRRDIVRRGRVRAGIEALREDCWHCRKATHPPCSAHGGLRSTERGRQNALALYYAKKAKTVVRGER